MSKENKTNTGLLNEVSELQVHLLTCLKLAEKLVAKTSFFEYEGRKLCSIRARLESVSADAMDVFHSLPDDTK